MCHFIFFLEDLCLRTLLSMPFKAEPTYTYRPAGKTCVPKAPVEILVFVGRSAIRQYVPFMRPGNATERFTSSHNDVKLRAISKTHISLDAMSKHRIPLGMGHGRCCFTGVHTYRRRRIHRSEPRRQIHHYKCRGG